MQSILTLDPFSSQSFTNQFDAIEMLISTEKELCIDCQQEKNGQSDPISVPIWPN